MKKYIIIEPITNVRTGEKFAKGDTVELDPTNGQVRAWVHFGQIKEAPAKKGEKEGGDK